MLSSTSEGLKMVIDGAWLIGGAIFAAAFALLGLVLLLAWSKRRAAGRQRLMPEQKNESWPLWI